MTRWRRVLFRPIERVLGAVARASYEHPAVALLSFALVAALAWPGVARLRVDADLARLLPSSFASVSALERLEQRFGATGSIVVVASGGEPEELRAFAQRLAPELEALPTIRYVDYRRPSEWFEQRALLYLNEQQLEAATARLRERVDWEVMQRNPLYVSLEDEAPPRLELEDLRPAPVQGLFTSRSSSGYYEDADERMLVLFARPTGSSIDLSSSERALADVARVLDQFRGPGQPTTRLTGRLQKKLEQKQQISSDLSLASSLAALLVALYLVWHFRSFKAVPLLGLPLLAGIGASLGVVGATYGELNILTAFVGVMLIGLGIDHGIHLLGAYERKLACGNTGAVAVGEVFGSTGRAVLTAALTTAAGFVGLTLSEFRAFREFGVVATLGMCGIILAFWGLMPALLRCLRYQPWPARARSGVATRWFKSLQQNTRAVAMGLCGVLVLLVLPLRDVHFNYDFAALEDSDLPAMRLDKTVNSILGHSQTPTVILAESREVEQQVLQRLRATMNDPAVDSTLELALTLDDAVPERQATKMRQIAELRQVLSRMPREALRAEQRERFDRLWSMTEVEPFTREQLPIELTRRFGARGEREAVPAVLAFPAISLSDGASIPAFANEIRRAAGSLPAAGDTMVLADILHMIDQEGPFVLVVTVLLMAATMLLLLRRWVSCAFAASAGALTLMATVSVHAVLGGSLNYLNIVIIPVLLGVSVDGAIYLSRAASRDVPAVLRAIAGALLTTACGFAPLLLAAHPGLQSVGALALVGLSVNALVSLVFVPAGLYLAGGEETGREVYA